MTRQGTVFIGSTALTGEIEERPWGVHVAAPHDVNAAGEAKKSQIAKTLPWHRVDCIHYPQPVEVVG